MPEASAARSRVQEEPAIVGANEAVGQTRAIIGRIEGDAAGLPLACSRFDVDLRTLRSDSARRDNDLDQNTVETETFPPATLVVRAVAGLDAPLVEGEAMTLTLIGDLTVKDATPAGRLGDDATHKGGRLTGSAATHFEMPDFNIEPPSVQVVLSLDETVRLDVDLIAWAES